MDHPAFDRYAYAGNLAARGAQMIEKRKTKADAAVDVMDSTVTIAAERWRDFCGLLKFRDDVGLADRISAFSVPFALGARKSIPALRKAPEWLVLMIVAMGVERSGTHTRLEIEEALGVRLPT